MNLKAEYVGEAQTDEKAISSVLKGDIQTLLISPESLLLNPRFRNMLLSKPYKDDLVAVIVDEAHCVKTWGDEFRVSFAEIGTLRSIIPADVNILALTATASKATLDAVILRVALKNPVVIGTSPNRANIFYSLGPILSVSELSGQLSSELLLKNVNTPKTIVFCQSFVDCYKLYEAIERAMKEKFTYPPDYPDMHQFRLVEMYHSGCITYVREAIINSFTKEACTLRVVIATSSFGMGIDCPDIRRIIHWGTPMQYVQETGRAGRDHLPCKAILYPKRRHIISDTMQYYCRNETECRRSVLLKGFLFNDYTQPDKVHCCDVCFKLSDASSRT